VLVTRDAVQLAPVQGLWLDAQGQWRYWLDTDAKIAYLQITDFNQRTAIEMEIALAVLQNRGVRGLILDLRGCPGGLLEEGVKVASLLIKRGPVASIRGRQTPEQTLEVDGTAKYADLPLIVLVDDNTASAAEVLAAAIQDRQRGIVMGQRTLGKGSVQAFIPVGGSDAKLRLTTGTIHRASGVPLAASPGAAAWGVDPNDGYYVPLSLEQRDAFRQSASRRDTLGALNLPESLAAEQIEQELSDPALAAALRSMAAKLSSGSFAATGRPLSERESLPIDRERLRRERDELRAKLQQIDEQLGTQR
jgi:carboxyl-terminal processing protease